LKGDLEFSHSEKTRFFIRQSKNKNSRAENENINKYGLLRIASQHIIRCEARESQTNLAFNCLMYL
jgi:hypothetical protein